MSDSTSVILCPHGRAIHDCASCGQNASHADLAANLNELLANASPRLHRLARLQGITGDGADDVVQETLLEAWRHLDHLRTPERFDAWLEGICRNVCKRYTHMQTQNGHRFIPFHMTDVEIAEQNDSPLAIADPQAFDPVEELDRQDMALLLDRALGYLSEESRRLVELCYLENVPQREVALQLGLTIGALELKLHRTRRRLRQLLNGELRAEAETFGLIDQEESAGWRETRQWCWLCGKQRLRGILERATNGQSSMRLRCPDCSYRYNLDVTTATFLEGNTRSFRPAIKRALHEIGPFFSEMLNQQRCVQCGSPVNIEVRAFGNGEMPYIPGRFYLYLQCPLCGIRATDIVSTFLSHPKVLQFMLQHTRCISLPITHLRYSGQEALRSPIIDLDTGVQLIVIAHAETLRVLDVLEAIGDL
ncbi:MAG TPA: RNA polymerase sigma factor [Ktedonobacteraceae bacterium]|jgi:RNA polymerase sigma-70 factor (ECF subfamily)|nr:RNA polymerase sigma factor [Ktedonobacteraceae bacterium]